MADTTILWADDEIDLLKPQIIYLNQRGYEITAVTNGQDAIDELKTNRFDVVFLDESMPGLSGLETLAKVKEINGLVPVVLITKNEEENLMDEAIGAQIDDYLIKPVKPQQIVLTLKRLTDNKRLISQKTASDYQQAFQHLFMAFPNNQTPHDWAETYEKLVYWELQLQQSGDTGMDEVLHMQKQEANNEFTKFVTANYLNWVNLPDSAPIMSHTLFAKKILPLIDDEVSTFLIVIDNLRYDQWKIISPFLASMFKPVVEETFFSILPTSTQYSRNALFAGMLPLDIEKHYPECWVNDEETKGKNLYEAELLAAQLKRYQKNIKFSYKKITNVSAGKELVDNVINLLSNPLNVIVYNFVDMLSHARTEMEVLKELASNESAYRSLTRSWFEHSPLFSAIKKLKGKPIRLVIATDHGTVRVKKPVKVIGDRNTTTNLRYKTGRNLSYNQKEVYSVKSPADAFLPRQHLSSTYIFATDYDFLAYPNNYNHYANYYKDTFQHGGISLEEMIVPFAVFEFE